MGIDKLTAKDTDSLPFIQPFPTKGLANLTEQAVQKLVELPRNDHASILAGYNELVNRHFNNSVTGEYAKAGWKNKVTLAAMGHIAARNAMLNILDSYHYLGATGSLEIPSHCEATSMHNIAEAQSKHAPYWLTYHSRKLLENSSSQFSKYSVLRRQGEENADNFWTTLTVWQEGPGKNRWPSNKVERSDLTLHQQLMNMFNFNTDLALSLLCTRAIHYLTYTNSKASSDELYHVATQSIEEFSWATTTNRHLSWTPDWKERERLGLYQQKGAPRDGVAALLQECPSDVTRPNKYAASVSGVDSMQNPIFCLQAETNDGPRETGSLCAGNVFYKPKDDYERECVRTFFSVLNMHPDNGNSYSLASIAFALAGHTLRSTILPAFTASTKKRGSTRS